MDFDLSFRNFYDRHREVFSGLKDYCFYRFDTVDAVDKPDVLILCDEDSANRPELETIRTVEPLLNVCKKTIREFVGSYSKETNTPRNYICVLCLTPNLKEDEPLRESIRNLFNLFDSAFELSLRTNKDGTLEDFTYKSFDNEILDTLSESSNKIFDNTSLSYEEQRVIKGFFGRGPAVIEYTVLKPGTSGSSVIEVRANFTRTKESKRYVIKIARKEQGERSKLKDEMKNFEDCVDHFSKTGYSAKYGDTENLEAIRYGYASTDSVSNSDSFSELVTKFVSDKNPSGNHLSPILEKLLASEIMNSWNKPSILTAKPGTLYKNHIKNEAKIIDTIQELYDRPSSDLLESQLLKTYGRIKSADLQTFRKTCHGDLHSENFFWDGSNVYLIDFGFTGVHHAVIDHTILESSIRLKHFPRYIPIEELLDYEKKFLGLESFQPNFDLSFIKRQKLRELYRLINLIRIDSRKYSYEKSSVKEYLTSLFLITFRQIQYADLNQLYALKMAELLTEELK